MNVTSLDHMMDCDIVADVLTHMTSIIDQCELHKITKRRQVAQAAYAVAKVFGYRSAYHDLHLTHPSMKHHVLAPGEDVIPMGGVNGVEIYWRLTLLGEESKAGATGTSASDRLSGNTAMANQVEGDVRRGFKFIVVTMEMTGSAFSQLCHECGRKTTLSGKVSNMLKAKWGSKGTSFGVYQAAVGNGDGYRFVRLMDGVPKVYQQGWGGWVTP
jgi:hypothetical protein